MLHTSVEQKHPLVDSYALPKEHEIPFPRGDPMRLYPLVVDITVRLHSTHHLALLGLVVPRGDRGESCEYAMNVAGLQRHAQPAN